MSYYLLFSKINYSFFITFNLSHYSYVFGEFDSLVEVSCLDCYVNIHANFLPLEMSRGGRGGQVPPWTSKIFTNNNNTLHWNVLFAPPTQKTKKTFLFTATCFRTQQPQLIGGCLVCVFKQSFLVFKEHFTHFNTLFHSHVFP